MEKIKEFIRNGEINLAAELLFSAEIGGSIWVDDTEYKINLKNRTVRWGRNWSAYTYQNGKIENDVLGSFHIDDLSRTVLIEFIQ